MTDNSLRALVLVCSLKPSPAESSSLCKVALVAVVGNEDGAHHVVAECLQALNDTGFSIASNAGTYWVGEAMQATDYRELDPSPEKTVSATDGAVRHAVHLARLLKEHPYPA